MQESEMTRLHLRRFTTVVVGLRRTNEDDAFDA